MENNNSNGLHPSAPVHTSSDLFGDWLTVQEAVAYCLSKGLHRTPKTVRKWAQRARDPQSGTSEIVVRAQDTENGYRWLIERNSLDVKIEQEKQFETRKVDGEDGAHLFAPVATSAHLSEQVRSDESITGAASVAAHLSEHVATSAHQFEGERAQEAKRTAAGANEFVEFLKTQLERVERQLDVKDRQIDALLERDRETNILIQGLQTSLTGVVNALPTGQKEMPQSRSNFRHHDGITSEAEPHSPN